MALSRRALIGAGGAAAALIGSGLVSGRVQAASIPEAPTTDSPATQPPLMPTTGPDYNPVVTLNGWTLPPRINGKWKEFHLVAEPVVREFAPGMVAHLWGYNGQSPGPTLEAVEGDFVRIFVTNRLPEHTTIHWHGQLLPNGMDGVGGLTQPHIPVGRTFVYEFQLRKSGTFMYHPHADEMVQMAMGMMGFFVVHPKDPMFRRVDRDFVFLMSAYDIEPGAYVPRTSEMTDFNLWTWNSRVFPGIDPLPVAKGDKVRVRFGNLTMTNHPIHMHGYDFKVSCTDGGWVPEEAAWPEVTIDCAVGQMRAFDFVADVPGDWAIHCHKSHHTMNAMGHDVANWIGTDRDAVTSTIRKLVPDYMSMGSAGMADMGEMEMPLPDNTLPMMTGWAQFGAVEMGGMFSVVKVRDGLAPHDYADPGDYAHPEGTVSFEWTGEEQPVERPAEEPVASPAIDLQVVKPTSAAAILATKRKGPEMRSILSIGVFCALATVAIADAGHAHNDELTYGEPGSPDHRSKVVEVAMMEDGTGAMKFSPAEIRIHKGDQVRFVIRNGGTMDHELVVGTLAENLKHAEQMAKNPDMEHDDPNAIRLAPTASGEILWAFTKSGTFDFSCLLPGHREAGMFGTIIVE